MMSRSRFVSLFNGVTGNARKVYEAVPITDHWTAQQISAELKRVGQHFDFHTLRGCINTLCRAGLVVEPSKGVFRREGVRTDPGVREEPDSTPIPQDNKEIVMVAKPTGKHPAAAPKKPVTALDRLGLLAKRAAEMAAALQQLANDISDEAVAIQSQVEMSEEDINNYRQLQALLSNIRTPAVQSAA